MTSLAVALKNRGKQAAKRLLRYDSRNWLRIRQIEAFTTFLEAANRKSRDVIEISPGWNRYWRALCPNYRSVDFPEFDICRDRTEEQYSIVIADRRQHPFHGEAWRLGDGGDALSFSRTRPPARLQPLDARGPEAVDGRGRFRRG